MKLFQMTGFYEEYWMLHGSYMYSAYFKIVYVCVCVCMYVVGGAIYIAIG